ncbi:uncharacterized protein [Lepeophtheirus salmonis]|uniref:uncharacterized protein isoform X2 n=1 Tax=Lepeophtheirus salmonis TaxID=72036 RepID=UPI003AF3EF8A
MSWSSQRFLIILILLVVENQSIIFSKESKIHQELIPLFDWDYLWNDIQGIFQNCSYRLPNYFLCGDSHKENKSCQCDKDCIEYGDCCFDFARSFIHERTSSLIPLQNCESLNVSTEIYMINYCLSNNTDIKNKCEKRADPYNFLMDIPVTSSKTLVTYSNIFCALCHDDISLRAFNYSLSCSNQNIIEACGLSVSQDICSDENYNPKTRSWTKFLQPNDSKNNCTIAGYPITCQLNLLVDIPNMRLCQTNVKRTCSLVDTVGLIYCNLYSLPLEYEGNIYQNPHCAVCNKLALEQLNICSQEYSRRYLYKKSGIMKEYISSKEFELSFKDIRCEDDDERSNYFWNSFNSECYYVDCGKLYENQNGKCNYQNFTKQLDGNCNNILDLMPWEVRILTNGTIHYKRKDIYFDIGEYELYFMSQEDYQPINRLYRVCSQDKDYPFFKRDKNIQFLHEICTSLSLISLSTHIFIHTALKKLRNLFVQNILGLSCALFIYQFIMITGLTYNDSHSICMFIATMLHYFQLVAYSWLDIICYDLYRTLLVKDLTNLKTVEGKRRFKLYSYYAWGVPGIIVSLGILLDQIQALEEYHPYYAKGDLCWINTRNGLLLFFVIPLGFSIFKNMCLLLTTLAYWIKMIRKPSTQFHSSIDGSRDIKDSVGEDTFKSPTKKNDVRRITRRLWSTFCIYLLMTLLFIFGICGIYLEKKGLWYSFVLINGLPGICISICYTFKLKVYYMIYQKILGRPHPSFKERKGCIEKKRVNNSKNQVKSKNSRTRKDAREPPIHQNSNKNKLKRQNPVIEDVNVPMSPTIKKSSDKRKRAPVVLNSSSLSSTSIDGETIV